MSTADLLLNERLQTFWYFVAERQNIYWRRREEKPRPWTKDPVLDKHFFCNVYRELDRGTQFIWNEIVSSHSVRSGMPDLLFRVLIYRMFNEPRTYEYLRKLIVNGYNGRKAAEILDRKRDAGITVFRGAWMTSGANVVGSKAKAYCLEMDRVYKHREDIWERVKDAGSMEAAWRVICELKWFGGFSAYQVVLDLSYITGIRSLWPDYDMWVYPGPGAKMGLMWLMGKNPIRRKGAGERPSEKVCSRLIYHLRDKQDDYFKKFKYKFRRWEDKPLDLHNIEYSLCEANKYFRAHYGGKKKKFIPHDEQGKLF